MGESREKKSNGQNIERDNSYVICHEKKANGLSIGRDNMHEICHEKKGLSIGRVLIPM